MKIAQAFALFGLAIGSALADEKRTRFPFDPVELVAGRELAGAERWSATHYLYSYQFASEANRAAFLADPAKYEVQLGGACARMGPLSGRGRPELHAVHDKKLYLFASEACRKSFLKAPERLLETSEAPPATDAEGAARARQWLDKAVTAHGGAAVIDGVKTLSERSERTETSGGVEYRVTEARAFAFPDRARHDGSWNDSRWSSVGSGDRGWFLGSDERPMHAQQLWAFRRETLARNLVRLLQLRSDPKVVLADAGAGVLDTPAGKRPVQRVTIAVDGSNQTLSLDVETGRVLAHAFRGRSPSAAIVEIERTFADFATVAGVLLPGTVTVRADGGDDETRTWRYEVNPALDGATFAEPAWPQ